MKVFTIGSRICWVQCEKSRPKIKNGIIKSMTINAEGTKYVPTPYGGFDVPKEIAFDNEFDAVSYFKKELDSQLKELTEEYRLSDKL